MTRHLSAGEVQRMFNAIDLSRDRQIAVQFAHDRRALRVKRGRMCVGCGDVVDDDSPLPRFCSACVDDMAQDLNELPFKEGAPDPKRCERCGKFGASPVEIEGDPYELCPACWDSHHDNLDRLDEWFEEAFDDR